ncbi:MAG: hypothetical protein KDA91_07680 [Planctomycetaceae bacterium]|nr:hypothetical protein [Planctomycetaceae bacterium]
MACRPVPQFPEYAAKKKALAGIIRFRQELFLKVVLALVICGCNRGTSTSEPTTTHSSPRRPGASAGDAEVTAPSASLETILPTDSISAEQNSGKPGKRFVVPSETIATPQELRLDDDRPALNRSSMLNSGITVTDSPHLILCTDTNIASNSQLHQFAGQLFDHLEKEVGPLNRSRNGSVFQTTGFLIQARERFEEAGVMPDPNFTIQHGRHLGYQFWMFDPESEYYRRHLLLHEFIHCYMMCEHGNRNIPPLWFTEGIAEYWATHSVTATPSGPIAQFGVLPDSIVDFEGWGRISEIRRSFEGTVIHGVGFQPVQHDQLLSDQVSCERRELNESAEKVVDAGFVPLRTVLYPKTPRFQDDWQYAHAWALCWMLSHHPDYADRFSRLRRIREGSAFEAMFEREFRPLLDTMAIEWLLTLDSLIEGFDMTRSFPRRSIVQTVQHQNPQSLDAGELATVKVRADRGWQFTGLTIGEGEQSRIDASGQFTLGMEELPLVSEAAGITLEYYRGRPVGELQAILVSTDGSLASRRFAIGCSGSIQLPFRAELWLQLNEPESMRADNSGSVNVRIRSSGNSPAANTHPQ